MNEVTKARPTRWRWLVLGIVALVILTLTVYYATAPRPPTVSIQGGDPAIPAAIGKARALVSVLPRSGEAWGRLGMVLYIHNFCREADVCFVQAERFDPRNPGWPYLRALSAQQANAPDILPMLQRAAELTGDGPAAPRLMLAEMLIGLGRLDEAETQLRTVLTRDPNDPRALLAMGSLSFARNDMVMSRDNLERSLRQQPTQPAYALLATVLQRLGQSQDAEIQRKLAAQISGGAPWVDPYRRKAKQMGVSLQRRLKREKDLFEHGQTADAIKGMRQLTVDYPDSEKAWEFLGAMYSRQNNLAAAEQALRQRLTRAGPASPRAHFDLAAALISESKYTEAQEHLHETLRLLPSYGPGWFNLGVCLAWTNDWTRATAAFQNAVQFEPDVAEAHRWLGNALAKQGKLAEAIPHLSNAVRLKPDDTEARCDLGIILKETGDSAGAVVHYTEALQLNRDLLVALNNLAWIRATSADPQLRNGKEAIRMADRACYLTARHRADCLDTLAAAYAEAQRFDEAVATAQEALALARATNQTTAANEMTLRLDLYRGHLPYRDLPPKPAGESMGYLFPDSGGTNANVRALDAEQLNNR